MKVLSGALKEDQFAWPGNVDDEAMDTTKIQLISEKIYPGDAVTYIHDDIGLHQIKNPMETQMSYSLHLYSPPIAECRMFDPITGESQKGTCNTMYSENGFVKLAE